MWPTIAKSCSWNCENGGSIESLWLFLEIVERFPVVLTNKALMIEACGRKSLITEEFCKEAADLIMVRYRGKKIPYGP